MNIKIRKAKASDYKTVIKLYGDFLKDHKRFEKNNDSFKKCLIDKYSFLDLAFVENMPVGFIEYSMRRVTRYPDPLMEIEGFYVDHKFRKMGIGNKLMQQVFKTARANKCIKLFVPSGNEWCIAHQFYKKIGFEEYGKHFRIKITM